MTLEDCFHVLGLRPSAGGREIKSAFRRLAKAHHPDLQGEETDREPFVRIVSAYKRLQDELRLHSADDDARPCPSCGKVADLFDGSDGRAACVECLLGVTRRRRLLPLPSITTVRHGTVVLLETASLVCFFLALVKEDRAYAAASLLAGLAALLVLALTCITVKYVKP
ncbi:MAG: J domain-containing protein [Planctomycetota bacterium]